MQVATLAAGPFPDSAVPSTRARLRELLFLGVWTEVGVRVPEGCCSFPCPKI